MIAMWPRARCAAANTFRQKEHGMSIRAYPPARHLAALAVLFVASTLRAACAVPGTSATGAPTVPAATATPTRPPAGQLAEFPIPGAHSAQLNIVAGPD